MPYIFMIEHVRDEGPRFPYYFSKMCGQCDIFCEVGVVISLGNVLFETKKIENINKFEQYKNYQVYGDQHHQSIAVLPQE